MQDIIIYVTYESSIDCSLLCLNSSCSSVADQATGLHIKKVTSLVLVGDSKFFLGSANACDTLNNFLFSGSCCSYLLHVHGQAPQSNKPLEKDELKFSLY